MCVHLSIILFNKLIQFISGRQKTKLFQGLSDPEQYYKWKQSISY